MKNIEPRRSEVEKAKLAMGVGVFLTVEVGFRAVGEAVGGHIVVLQHIVHLLQNDGLKDERRQKGGCYLAICEAFFHRFLSQNNRCRYNHAPPFYKSK